MNTGPLCIPCFMYKANESPTKINKSFCPLLPISYLHDISIINLLVTTLYNGQDGLPFVSPQSAPSYTISERILHIYNTILLNLIIKTSYIYIPAFKRHQGVNLED